MPATDLLSPTDALKAVQRGTKSALQQDRLAGYVTAISNRLDELVGPIVQRPVAGERLHGGHSRVRVRRWPVAEFTAVAEYQSGVATVLAAEALDVEGGYYAEPWDEDPTLLSGRLLRRSGFSDSCWATGRGNVVVSYTAGRYPDTAAVRGTRYYQAAVITLKSLWRGEEDVVAMVNDFDQAVTFTPNAGIPKVVLDLLQDQVQQSGRVG